MLNNTHLRLVKVLLGPSVAVGGSVDICVSVSLLLPVETLTQDDGIRVNEGGFQIHGGSVSSLDGVCGGEHDAG